jgi:hypothetical protein
MREYLAIGAALLALTLPACSSSSGSAPSVASTGPFITTNIGFVNPNGSANTTFSATPTSGGVPTFTFTLAEANIVAGKTVKYTGTFTVVPSPTTAACISVASAGGTAYTMTETCTATSNGVYTVTDSTGVSVQMLVNFITQN